MSDPKSPLEEASKDPKLTADTTADKNAARLAALKKIEGARNAAKVPKKRYLDEAEQVSEIDRESYRIKALLGGHSGVGKTTSAAISLSHLGKVLVLDWDNRAQSLAGIPNIKRIRLDEENPRSPKSWRKGEDILQELQAQVRARTLEYIAILDDGLSAMNDICMYWSLLLDPKRGLGGSPAQQHYGPHIKNITDHIKSMISLPVHYVLTCHYNLLQDEETGALIYLPKIYGKQQRTSVATWFDECYLAYSEPDKNGRDKYFWRTSGYGRFNDLKSSLNQFGKYWSGPIEIDLTKEVSGFELLLEKRFGRKEG